MATSFIRCITTVVAKITNFAAIHTISIGTFEITKDIGTRSWTIGAHGHIILVRAVTTIVIAITNIVPGDTFEVVTLEFVNIIASEISTTFFSFITSITTIVSSVAKIVKFDA